MNTLQILRVLGVAPRPARDLAKLAGASTLQASNALQVLRRHGLAHYARGWHITEAGVAWLAAGKGFVPGTGKRPRTRARGLRARAWWVMRQLGRWTLADLLTTVAEGTERDAPTGLYQWMLTLERVGIVARLKRQAEGATIWRLARDLGREAPVWRREARTVYDPNSQQELPLDIAQQEPSHEQA